MKKDIKNRLSNYGLWVSVASLVLLVVKNLGYDIDAGEYNAIVDAILVILVALGIVNNPATENHGYFDDEK